MIVDNFYDSEKFETSFSVMYRDRWIVVRFILPLKSHYKGWYTCYVCSSISLTSEELDKIPHVAITYDGVYSSLWVNSMLSNKNVIGWDYNHGYDSENSLSFQDILNDAHKVVDYLCEIEKQRINNKFGGN